MLQQRHILLSQRGAKAVAVYALFARERGPLTNASLVDTQPYVLIQK